MSKPTTLQTVSEDSNVMIGEGPTLDRPLTSLEKVHYIVGYGIIRPDLRFQLFASLRLRSSDLKLLLLEN